MDERNNFLDKIILTDISEEDSGELIQLINPEEDGESSMDIPTNIPILPVKNTVLFPGVIIPITVGRNKSVKLVKKAYKSDRIIGVIAQKNPKSEDPGEDDIFRVGTVAKIVKMLVLPDGNTTIIIQGKQRFNIKEITS